MIIVCMVGWGKVLPSRRNASRAHSGTYGDTFLPAVTPVFPLTYTPIPIAHTYLAHIHV